MKKQDLLPSLFSNRESFFTTADSVFDSLIKSNFPEFSQDFSFTNSAYPKVNVIDYPDKIVLESEIAGMFEKDIDISIEDNMITISGGKKEELSLPENAKYLYRELKRSKFQRGFIVDKNKFRLDKAEAKFNDGLLTINIPKSEQEVKVVKKLEIKK